MRGWVLSSNGRFKAQMPRYARTAPLSTIPRRTASACRQPAICWSVSERAGDPQHGSPNIDCGRVCHLVTSMRARYLRDARRLSYLNVVSRSISERNARPLASSSSAIENVAVVTVMSPTSTPNGLRAPGYTSTACRQPINDQWRVIFRWTSAGPACEYRSIMITQIGPSRSPGSVDRDHRDRHRDHGDRSIVITPRRARGRASSFGGMAGA